MSAIEELNKLRIKLNSFLEEEILEPDEKLNKALDEAIVCLEQKDKLKVWLEKRIRITKTDMRNEINLQIICGKGGKLKAYKEVLELIKNNKGVEVNE